MILILNKIKKIGKLPVGAIICTIDVIDLYLNIPYGEGLAYLYNFLETRDKKKIASDTLAELAEVVLKNNILKFDANTFKLKRGTVSGTKFAPSYVYLFMANLMEKMLETFKNKPMV